MVTLSLGNQKLEFTESTPEEFMKYSTIPPFKIFFRVPISEKEKSKKEGISLLLQFLKIRLTS